MERPYLTITRVRPLQNNRIMFLWKTIISPVILSAHYDTEKIKNKLSIINYMAGSHASRARESGQAGNRAAISVSMVVLWVNPAIFCE